MKTSLVVAATVATSLMQTGVCYANQEVSLIQKNSIARAVLAANEERGVMAGANEKNEPCQIETHTFDLNDSHGDDSPYLGLLQIRVQFDIGNPHIEDRLFEFQLTKSAFGNQLRHQSGTIWGRIILNDKILTNTVNYDSNDIITSFERWVDGKLVKRCTIKT
jgi:hypothetical protein